MENVHAVLAQEKLVGHVTVGEQRRVEHGRGDRIALDKLHESRQHHALQLEATFVVCVSQDEECVLDQAEVEVGEEHVGNRWVGVREIIHELEHH
jgi:hypothetical protein